MEMLNGDLVFSS